MAVRNFCDRCGEEIPSGKDLGAVRVEFPKGSLTKRLLDMICESCVNDIVRAMSTAAVVKSR